MNGKPGEEIELKFAKVAPPSHPPTNPPLTAMTHKLNVCQFVAGNTKNQIGFDFALNERGVIEKRGEKRGLDLVLRVGMINERQKGATCGLTSPPMDATFTKQSQKAVMMCCYL